MEKLDILENKVRKASEMLTALRNDNQKLQAELNFLHEENQRAKQLIRENETLREEKKTIASRIEKLLKKINSLTH